MYCVYIAASSSPVSAPRQIGVLRIIAPTRPIDAVRLTGLFPTNRRTSYISPPLEMILPTPPGNKANTCYIPLSGVYMYCVYITTSAPIDVLRIYRRPPPYIRISYISPPPALYTYFVYIAANRPINVFRIYRRGFQPPTPPGNKANACYIHPSAYICIAYISPRPGV
jgi:hypothetical protein